MLPAQVLRNRHREVDLSVLSHFHFRDQLFLRRESVAAYPISNERLPEEIQCGAGRKPFPTEPGLGAHWALDWTKAQLSIRYEDFRIRQRIRLVFVRVSSGRRGRRCCRVEREFRTRQV